jgi:hypothetical protein
VFECCQALPAPSGRVGWGEWKKLESEDGRETEMRGREHSRGAVESKK